MPIERRSEFELIRRMIAGLYRDGSVILGPGDDAAVVRPRAGFDLVASTDTFVNDRHYSYRHFTPALVGARLGVANLSDLAAMAALPRWALLAAGVRASEARHLEDVQQGVARALGADGVSLVGGNVTAVDGEEWFTLTLLGEVEPGRAWTRAGARAGDVLAVTGSPGRAGAGWRLAFERAGVDVPGVEHLRNAWLRPASRVAVARALAAIGGVTAAVDLSDGVRGDLAHLCEASRLGVEVEEAAWPEDAPLVAAAAELGVTPLDLRLAPSDDYELMLAIAPEQLAACVEAARAAGVPLTPVGRFLAGSGLTLRRADGRTEPLPGAGYDHFA